MNHYDRLFWHAYVADTLEETDRQRAEDHLLGCDACLELYAACMEAESSRLPALGSKQCEEMADDAVRSLFPKKRWFQHTLFHYAVAASLTLLLMSSGAFDRMTYAVQLEERTESRSTLTDKLMRTADSWLNALESPWKERKPDHE